MSIRSWRRPAASFMRISVGTQTKQTSIAPCKGSFILFFEGEGFGHEQVDGHLDMLIAPELQHLHVLVSDPAFPQCRIGELLRRDRHHWAITQAAKRDEGALDVIPPPW
jgi:hypothetical protein